MIQTEHITKSFGRTHILSGISLHVRDRELVAYLGPNGAGKTTTVRILSGQARADGGTVKLAGRNLTEHPLEAKALCGVVSQHLNLDAELSVRENLDIHGRLFGMNASERKEGITSLLETVEMAHKVDVLTKTLSGGEKRRIMLARALLHKPRILFLDEPTVGLDPLIRRKLWGLIKRIQQEGTTILLTTHYIEEAEFLADRVIFLDKGRIVAEGTPNALMNRIGQWALDVQCNGLLTTRYFNERDEAARETTQEQGTSTVTPHTQTVCFVARLAASVSGGFSLRHERYARRLASLCRFPPARARSHEQHDPKLGHRQRHQHQPFLLAYL